MRTIPLLEAPVVDGGVFVDNLMISSADRLLFTRYENLEHDRLFLSKGHEAIVGQHRKSLASALLMHDLLNLAILVESIVCHERLFVNTEYMDRWNADAAVNVLQPLSDLVVGVSTPPNLFREIQTAVATQSTWSDYNWSDPLHSLTDLVSHATHDPFYRGREDPIGANDIEKRFFFPFNEDSGRPFTAGYNIGYGTGFYAAASQLLGVPYKPSVLRASAVRGLLRYEVLRWRVDTGDLAIRFLEESRGKAAGRYFAQLLELGAVEEYILCILAVVLRRAHTSGEIIEVAVRLRETKEAQAFRAWTGRFAETIQHGDLTEVGKYVKELRKITERVNKAMQLEHDQSMSLKLGWGPASLSKTFGVPAILQRPMTLRRHLWFLHGLYRLMMSLTRVSDDIDRIIVSALPGWFSHELRGGMRDWSALREVLKRETWPHREE